MTAEFHFWPAAFYIQIMHITQESADNSTTRFHWMRNWQPVEFLLLGVCVCVERDKRHRENCMCVCVEWGWLLSHLNQEVFGRVGLKKKKKKGRDRKFPGTEHSAARDIPAPHSSKEGNLRWITGCFSRARANGEEGSFAQIQVKRQRWTHLCNYMIALQSCAPCSSVQGAQHVGFPHCKV